MSIEVANESGVAVDESALASVARHVLAAMRVNPAAELSVMVVTTEVMTELHERWMDEPGPTDVMAFPMDELVDESRRPDAPEIGPALLGDVVLCPAFAAAQARKAGHGLGDELRAAHRARRAAPARLRPRRARAGARDVRPAERAARASGSPPGTRPPRGRPSVATTRGCSAPSASTTPDRRSDEPVTRRPDRHRRAAGPARRACSLPRTPH